MKINTTFQVPVQNTLLRSYKIPNPIEAALASVRTSGSDVTAKLSTLLEGTDASNDSIIELIQQISTAVSAEATARTAAITTAVGAIVPGVDASAVATAIDTKVNPKFAQEATARTTAISTAIEALTILDDATITAKIVAKVGEEATARTAAITTAITTAIDALTIPTTQYNDVTANATVLASSVSICDASAGAFTITLPAAPVKGDIVTILDDATSFATNNVTVDPAGKTIDGAATLVLSADDATTKLLFTTKWRVI